MVYFVTIAKPTDMAGSKEAMAKYEKRKKIIGSRIEIVRCFGG